MRSTPNAAFQPSAYGSGGAENNAPYICSVHGLEKCQGAAYVVVKVAHGLRHRLTHRFESCKVDDTTNAVFRKNAIQRRTVTYIGLNKAKALACEGLDSLQYLDAAVAKVVHNDHFMPSIQ